MTLANTLRGRKIASQVLEHMVGRIEATPAIESPFTHVYIENIFPDAVYRQLLEALPAPELFQASAERHHGDGEGDYVRSMFSLNSSNLPKLNAAQDSVMRGIASALTAPELKRAMYAKLGADLTFRYGAKAGNPADLAGHARPTLYRETEGFEIPPHPDTRKKVVTMHLYLPADASQIELGTALYRRSLLGLPVGNWRNRFTKLKQFKFLPNSGYAFVVNNTLTKKSWHGRETLPPNSGVRNTLLNTFYEEARDGFGDYFPAAGETGQARAA